MSTYPPQFGQRGGYSQGAGSGGNGLGIAGFVLSLVGYMTCGLLCPVGVLLSAIALRKPPRGLATAGLVIGLIGTIIPAFFLMIYGVVVFTFCTALGSGLPEATTRWELEVASQKVVRFEHEHGGVPDDLTGAWLLMGEKDYWGHPLRYQKKSETEFEIRSAGADGVFDNGDDRVRNQAGLVTTPGGK